MRRIKLADLAAIGRVSIEELTIVRAQGIASDDAPTRVMTTEELDAALARDDRAHRAFAAAADMTASAVMASGVRFQTRLEVQP